MMWADLSVCHHGKNDIVSAALMNTSTEAKTADGVAFGDESPCQLRARARSYGKPYIEVY